jgi:hypothetical protein
VAFGETLRSGGYQEEKRHAERDAATGVSGGRGGGDVEEEADDDDDEVIVEVGTGIVKAFEGQEEVQVIMEVLEELTPSQQVELLRLSAFAAAAAEA